MNGRLFSKGLICLNERTIRAEMLLGAEAMEKLRKSHVAVFGLGGVGSWCAEALARTGVGKLTLIDQDTVGESNLNRQMCSLGSTIGRPKAGVMAERIRDIAPEIGVCALEARYEAAAREYFFGERYDYIADCIDLVACKLDLIQTAVERGIPIISALGTGNKTDAEKLTVSDISRTEGCPLARVVRKELRRRGINRLQVVYSPEEGLAPEKVETPPPGRRSVPGSLVWVPASAGMLMAQHIVLALAGRQER